MQFWVAHGRNVRRTCFRINQLGFHAAAVEGMIAWMEVLVVRGADSKPIDGHVCTVVHMFDDRRGSRFMKFRTAEDAQRAFTDAAPQWDPRDDTKAGLHQHHGYIGTVICVDKQVPWFYAWDPDEIEGDIARPMRTPEWYEERVRLGVESATLRVPPQQ